MISRFLPAAAGFALSLGVIPAMKAQGSLFTTLPVDTSKFVLVSAPIGNGERSRWCIASPRRVVRELFPGEKFEFLTLLEPHKAYQGSVAMLRRLDPAAQPRKYRFLWGGKGDDDDMKDVEMFDDWMTALDRR